MRILGGMAALAICVLMGWSKAFAYKMREELMRAFSADIQAFAVEMEYRTRNIKDIAHGLIKGNLGEFWRLFSEGTENMQSAEQAWYSAVNGYDGFGILSCEERALITETGRLIGRQNMQDSIKSLKQRSAEAAKRTEEIKLECSSKGIICRRLGLLGGLAVMLLIV